MKSLINIELPFLTEEYTSLIKPKPIPSDQFKEIYNDILLLTSEISVKYPDLYNHLDETPIALNKVPENEITVSELQNYLETLEIQLINYFNSHELNLLQLDFVF